MESSADEEVVEQYYYSEESEEDDWEKEANAKQDSRRIDAATPKSWK